MKTNGCSDCVNMAAARKREQYKAALLVDSRSHTFVEVDLERCSNNSGKREDGEHDEVLVMGEM